MRPFGIAGLQLRTSGIESNLPYLEARLHHMVAVFPWVEMVVFSELAAYGPSKARAEELPGPAEDAFRKMAKKHGVWLVTGSLYERKGKRIYNTASVVDPGGEVVGRHRKLFPFTPYEEGVEPGQEFLVFDVPEVGRFGVSICYDSWVPETSRTLAAMGAEVILHPSLTGTIDRDVELAIARATAATNQCYFVDINGLGAGGVGKSIVVGPHGDILHQAGAGEEVITLELDLDRVRRSRERGTMSLGQPLKSFRDRKVRFPVYTRGWHTRHRYLDGLGPLEKPRRIPGRGASSRDDSDDGSE
ncbi:MAG: carbon-nitrogen hydrolase family protein [Gemmatimonadota bacterium]